jgi:hypothetical protein
VSTVIIEELGGQKRKVTLRGSGLPLQGAEWGGEQIVDTSWNPGSPVATQQVMGPTEMPSSWEGEWRTNRLASLPCLVSEDGGSDKSIVFADALRDLVDAVRISAQLLRVTWVAKPGRKRVRIGRLTKFTSQDERADDLRWSATFTWIGRDASAAVAVSDADLTLAATTAAALAATDAASRIEANRIISANKQVPNGPTPFTLGQLEALANAPRKFTNQFARFAKAVAARLSQLGDIVQAVKDTPAAILNQIVDASSDAVSASNKFVDQLTRQGPETLSTSNRVANLLQAASYYGSAQTGAEQLAAASAQARLAAARRRSAARRVGTDPRSLTGAGDLLNVIVPKAGETLLSISRRFYAGADLSYELARANGLPGQTITPPRGPLIIPRREVLDRFKLTA